MLYEIFYYLGTPDFKTWPGLKENPELIPKIPTFEGIGLNFIKKKHSHFAEDEYDLLLKMLNLNPLSRPTCKEILQHNYFN